MKIRPSLRIYVLLAILVTGVTTILVLSALSVNYFVSGMDIAMRGSMIAQAQTRCGEDGQAYDQSRIYGGDPMERLATKHSEQP